ncbi:cytochrome c oxidase subunit II [Pedobacter antarcticus]|uniref:Cytochrome c oxidase subunit 2 n=2 Tax=Pedobacter antarcticus TaxID=34086 RepID=A0A081PGV3_9SPHI|nr:cytochrome c oxidase subunit II [Pedobacter antarcticus]KEQ29926.1 heme transporter CcmD [Pedobacter antarcticus 4BY]SDL98299.1 cytochrome c oxidase subunit 2 [Pedobacter antarcticus]SFE79390.1 cytochrome c oxidase subunit 2 [Pedobacter antarcticus]
MSLRKFISNKTIAALAVIVTVFANTSAFAQEAAAGAAATAAKPIDMLPIYKSVAFYTLLFLLVCLFIAIIGKALRVYELTREAQDKPEGINWNTINAVLFILFLIVGLGGVYFEYTVHGSMILPDAASEHGKKIDQMFNITLILTTIVFIGTHIVLFVFSYIYKHSGKRKAYYYPHNNALERIWTIVPALVLTVLVLMGFLTWRSIFYKIEDPNNKPISIEVTSQQFSWTIRYPGADGVVGLKNYKLITGTNGLGMDFNDKNNLDDQMAEEMVIPVNKPVRLILTSKDVLHSFYMPHFRVQLNTVPGMTSYFEFTPTITTADMQAKVNDPAFKFLFLCSKICGSGHYNMQKVVRVVSQAEYDAWIAEQPLIINNDLRKEFNLPLVADPAAGATPAAPADSTATAGKDSSAVAMNKPALKK